MPLNLSLKSSQAIPIDVRGLSAGISQGLEASQMANLLICVGNRSVKVSECFAISGNAGEDQKMILSGDLSNVHSIGRDMTGGNIVIKSARVGRHVGTAMSGGNITVDGDAGDFLGAEMTGGTIQVIGDAGNFIGAALEGGTYGMNRGEIFIAGSAGVGLGKRMRRGIIVVGGNVGQLAAWNMLAGTIVVLGSASKSAKTAAGISRGTVVLAGGDPGDGAIETSAFSGGSYSESQIVELLGTWLKKRCPNWLVESVEQKLRGRPFIKYNGIELNQNRAEIFVRPKDVDIK